jgi:hypothetical protein
MSWALAQAEPRIARLKRCRHFGGVVPTSATARGTRPTQRMQLRIAFLPGLPKPCSGYSPHRRTGTCQESQMLNRPASKKPQVAGVVIFQDLIHSCLLLVAAVGGNTYKQASLLERRLALEVSSLFSGK